MIDISLLKCDVSDPILGNTKFCLEQGFWGDINRDKFRPEAVFSKYCGLGANTAPSFRAPCSQMDIGCRGGATWLISMPGSSTGLLRGPIDHEHMVCEECSFNVIH